MLTDETRERLLAKLKDTGTISMHVSTTRNMNAIVNSIPDIKVVDGKIVFPPMPDYVPWHQDEEVVKEILRAMEAIENGDYEVVDNYPEDFDQVDVRKLNATKAD